MAEVIVSIQSCIYLNTYVNQFSCGLRFAALDGCVAGIKRLSSQKVQW